MNIKLSQGTIKAMTFSGGERHITLEGVIPFSAINVVARLQNSNDLMDLLLVSDALDRLRCRKHHLTIPYFPYGRQDRVCNEGEALSVKVVSDLINNLKFNDVEVWHPHSPVTGALLNNCTEYYPYSEKYIRAIMESVDFSGDCVLVAPDAGAAKMVNQLSKVLGKQMVTATKVRDTKTGEISQTRVQGLDDIVITDEMKFLIVDDICDGGRTFMRLAKELRLSYGVKQVDLLVTHGIFSQGIEALDWDINNVYYTNSLRGEISREIKITKEKLKCV